MKRFGKYRLRERIAVGGTAEVFKAAVVWADGTEEDVVLKKILPQHARDSSFRQLFQEEALVLASLKHPNIVQIRDFGEMQGTLFLALEYVDGADLDILLRRAERSGDRLTETMAAFLVAEVGHALDSIHTRTSSTGTPLRIVHRDISPHNILVSRRGEVKLADFGIAKSVIRDGRTTEGTIKGKFDYLSPEQASPGDPVGPGTDLFALGSVLYELLFGNPPFRGTTDVETLERVRYCRYTLDETRLPPEHRALCDIVRHCLQAMPADRPASAAELCAELEAYLGALDRKVAVAEIGLWVNRLLLERVGGSVDQLVKDLFGRKRPGGTAVLASREEATPSPEPATTAEVAAPPGRVAASRRWPTLVLVLTVAVVTATVTLGLSRYLAAPPAVNAPPTASGTPDARTAIDAAVAAASLPARAPDAARAAAPPRSDAGQRWLEVRSTPPGAQITVNDQPAGTTPAMLPAPAGPFRVELTRPGYRTWARTFRAPTGDVVLRPKLKRAKAQGRLTINSIPWARVYLDGRLLGTTPIQAARVPAGAHRVVLRDGKNHVLQSFVTHITPGHTRVHSFDHSRGKTGR